MIFIVSTDPFGAVQFQRQLKNIHNQFVEVYLSVEEVEQNLYKLPDVVLIHQSLELTDLLYLTQSIKAYDPIIQIVWICDANCLELQKMHKSYGVSHCLNQEDYFLEQITLITHEAKQQNLRDESCRKRIEHLRSSIFSAHSDSYSLI